MVLACKNQHKIWMCNLTISFKRTIINNKIHNKLKCSNKDKAIEMKNSTNLKMIGKVHSLELSLLILHTNSQLNSIIWLHKLNKVKKCLKWMHQVLLDRHLQNIKKAQFLMYQSNSNLLVYCLHRVQEVRVRKFWFSI